MPRVPGCAAGAAFALYFITLNHTRRYNYNFCLWKALHVPSYSATYFENVRAIRLGRDRQNEKI